MSAFRKDMGIGTDMEGELWTLDERY